MLFPPELGFFSAFFCCCLERKKARRPSVKRVRCGWVPVWMFQDGFRDNRPHSRITSQSTPSKSGNLALRNTHTHDGIQTGCTGSTCFFQPRSLTQWRSYASYPLAPFLISSLMSWVWQDSLTVQWQYSDTSTSSVVVTAVETCISLYLCLCLDPSPSLERKMQTCQPQRSIIRSLAE